MDIHTPIVINGINIKNRVALPPIVNVGWSNPDGMVSSKHIAHYERIAKGGTGLIIVEATCVNPTGRIFKYQLGIWDDNHIEGLARIAEAVHKHDTKVLIQLHHAGLTTRKAVAEKAFGPSVDPENNRSVELTQEQIDGLVNSFVSAARRAHLAGFDGVELHGAHGYLLNQFASSAINHRTDEYGGSHENRLQFAHQIIKGIREVAPPSFIIGYRMAGCSPTLTDGIEIAKLLQDYGVHYLHVSHGGEKGINPSVPNGFAFNHVVYMGTEVKKHVTVPVMVVNQIKSPERANMLLSNGLADTVAIGRDMLTDPDWVAKAKTGEAINLCVDCQPRCKRYTKPELCPLAE
ncbi:MAG TPA: NADH:flavin oxidoreductase [Bacteroidales bacterium]|nr:NADH:flavin oxidoreductase [Bacteroidales bacterium]